MPTLRVNPTIYLDQYDITSQFRSANLQLNAEPLDETVFGLTTRKMKAGLRVATLDMEGFFAAGVSPDQIDDILNTRLSSKQDVLATIAPLGTALDNELAYILSGVVLGYNPVQGSVADLQTITAAIRNREGTGGLIRGTILLPASPAITVTGNGVGRQLGAVSATQRVYAALHVFSASASDTLDVVVQSDTTGFPSPTARITFAQKTAAGFEFLSAPGPITDDFWRVNFTIGGVSPSFSAAVIVGIK